MDPFNLLFDWLINTLGLEGTSLLALLAITSIVCKLVSQLIPDDATGWKAVVRKICAVLGLAVSNRITSGVSVNDVAKAASTITTVQKRIETVKDL